MPAPAFGAGPEYTVGVEEELMLLDPHTLGLVPHAGHVVEAAHDAGHVKAEVRQCMVEIASRPWPTSLELLDDLVELRAEVLRAATVEGCLVAGAGVHPFSAPEHQPTTPTPRYLAIMAEVAYPWRRALVFGTHVHVAVASADKAVQVTEALLPDLPLLIALGASSPFWRGQATGLASNRLAALAGVPRTGIPPVFRRFGEYTDALDVLRRAGAVPDASHVWWDVRSQARLGTIEVRVLDAQPDVIDTAALAAVVQSLVRHHGRTWDDGFRTTADRFLLAENRWLALRHGLDARLVGADGRPHEAGELVSDLVVRLGESAAAVGATWALNRITRIANRGSAATAMLDRYKRRRELADVIRWLVDRTADVGPQDGTNGPQDPSRRCQI
jgi:carboxylate-amine ligase